LNLKQRKENNTSPKKDIKRYSFFRDLRKNMLSLKYLKNNKERNELTKI